MLFLRFIFKNLMSGLFALTALVVAVAMSSPIIALTLTNPLAQLYASAGPSQDQIVEARSQANFSVDAEFDSAVAQCEFVPENCPVEGAEGEGISGLALDEILHPSHGFVLFLSFHLDEFPDHRLLSLISHSSAPELDPPRSA